MKEFVIPVISALVATFGFALVYEIRKKNLIIASFCGAFSWTVYLVFGARTESLVFPYLMSGVAIALYSEIAARIFKAPATVYLTCGIIPLVPGLTIFRTMESCLLGDLTSFLDGLITTLKIGGAITLGLMVVSSFFKFFTSGLAAIKTK